MDLMLKRMRNRAGLSQAEAAEALGVKLRAYGSWERVEVRMVPLDGESEQVGRSTLHI